MGCTQTKIENEEAVTRCKERKELMKSAVSARNAFASHHSAYAVALKDTGAALSDFAQGEVHHHLQSSSQPPPAHFDPPIPPPPPPPLIRAVSMPEFVIPQSEPKPEHADTIREEEDDEMEEQTTPIHHLAHRRRGSRIAEGMAPVPPPPVSPPRPQPTNLTPPPPPPPDHKESTWDYFFSGTHGMLDPSLSHHEEIPGNSEEFGTRGYSAPEPPKRTTTENVEVDERKYGYEEKLKRAQNVNPDVGASSSSSIDTSKVESHVHAPEKVIETEVVKPVKKVKQVIHSQPSVPSNVSLLDILNALDDNFLKASQSAYEVSKILEANRMHYHSNFADNRGHIDHSARLMRVITWNRSIRGLQTPNDAIDDEVDAHESLASVLDKLLAWEKKLYDEVKAGELMKIEYQKKVAVLNKRKKHNTNPEALERAKAAVSHLHTRYIVDIQSMDSTVSEIAHLRDDHLYPKLVSLVEGMAKMWDIMNLQHKAQVKIVEDLRALDVNDAPSETTEEHHKRTIQLRGIADIWHTHFQKLMTYQKDYIVALNSWLRLNLIPIESNIREKVSSPPRVHRPPIQTLLHAWRENLERLPVDISIELQNGSLVSSLGKKKKQGLLRDLMKDLRKRGVARNIQFIPNARIPLLIFDSNHRGISCDISIDNLLGLIKSKLFFWITEIDERFRNMVLLVKEWAKSQNINNPKTGTLNSYSLSLLVIFHFQTCEPPILPPLQEFYAGNIADDLKGERVVAETEIQDVCAKNIARFKENRMGNSNTSNLAELFISFFKKFSTIDKRALEYAICTYTGKWEYTRNKHRLMGKAYNLIIEDPFDQSDNTARAVGKNQLTMISEAFDETSRKLLGNQDQLSLIASLVRPQIRAHFIQGYMNAQAGGYGGLGPGSQLSNTSHPAQVQYQRMQPNTYSSPNRHQQRQQFSTPIHGQHPRTPMNTYSSPNTYAQRPQPSSPVLPISNGFQNMQFNRHSSPNNFSQSHQFPSTVYHPVHSQYDNRHMETASSSSDVYSQRSGQAVQNHNQQSWRPKFSERR